MKKGTFNQLATLAAFASFLGFFAISAATQASEATSTEPTIVLSGADPLVIPVGEEYDDPGATAIDSEDGELTLYSTANQFVTTRAGAFQVSYTATDSDGNNVMVHRSVTVQSLEDYYGQPTNVRKVNDNRVRVTYANGDRRTLSLPVNRAKKIKLSASRDCIVFISGTKKSLFLANPYTGERVSSKQIRRKKNLMTRTKVVDIRPRADRLDELFVATLNERSGTLKLTALTMNQRSHNLKKRSTVTVKLDSTPNSIRMSRRKKTITVKNRNGKVLLKALYTRNKELKQK
jgi:hypothetical protein